MHVVITGGAGFLGRRLTSALLERGTLRDLAGHDTAIDRLTIVDVVAPALASDSRVTAVGGDIGDAAVLERVITADTSAVFHLAAVVSGMAEADFDLGMKVNVDASRALLDRCRALGRCPRFVFASSVAVFGGDVPAVVQDDTPLTPQTSYGMEKAIVELLLADYTRRGFVDGRVLRLPTITVRPGKPNAAASSFASGIIREPLNGEPAICPVDAATRIWVLSPATVVKCLIAGQEIPADRLGTHRAINLPGLSISAGEMVDTVRRIAGDEVADRVRFELNPRIAAMVSSWPGAWDTTRARALGFPADANFEAIVRSHMRERAELSAVSGERSS